MLRVKRKEKRTVILQTGDDVNIFNGGSQLGSGKVLSISDEGKAKILVEKIHKANVEQIPSLQFNIGMEIEWSVLFLGKRQDLPQKKARKITQKQKRKEEKKEQKRTDKFEEDIKLCKCRKKCVEKFEKDDLQRERNIYWSMKCPKEQNEYLSPLLVRKYKKVTTLVKAGNKERKYTREF